MVDFYAFLGHLMSEFCLVFPEAALGFKSLQNDLPAAEAVHPIMYHLLQNPQNHHGRFFFNADFQAIPRPSQPESL